MDGFTTDDLAHRTADVLAAANAFAVEVRQDDEHRYVVMSREQYDRMRSATRKVWRLEEMPDDMIQEMIAAIEAMPDDEDEEPPR